MSGACVKITHVVSNFYLIMNSNCLRHVLVVVQCRCSSLYKLDADNIHVYRLNRFAKNDMVEINTFNYYCCLKLI